MQNELMFGITLIILATLIGSWGAFFFKKSSEAVSKNIFCLLKKSTLYVGFLFYGVSALVFVYALKFGELSVLYPIAGLSYVWISFLSMIFLKEKMNDLKWFGIIMIIIGVVMIGFGA